VASSVSPEPVLLPAGTGDDLDAAVNLWPLVARLTDRLLPLDNSCQLQAPSGKYGADSLPGPESTPKVPPYLNRTAAAGRVELAAGGSWTVESADILSALAKESPGVGAAAVAINLAAVERLDTFGAWLIERIARRWREAGASAELTGVSPKFQGLLDELAAVNRVPMPRTTKPMLLGSIETLGRRSATFVSELYDFMGTLGEVVVALGRAIARPRAARLTSIVYHLDRIGWQASGIIVLITFLIGCIIAQQGLFNFRRFGAQDYVVSLVGILVLREIGVLLTAVMIAGRSGSSVTAELGSMKMREEIDALRTMGVDPAEVLLLPRVLALVIAMPILTFIGSIAALVGGGLVAWSYGGMSPLIYITRLHQAVGIGDFAVGMVKAPVMALVIGVIACAEGMRVKGSAESLGLQTTASVVKSIFTVIVLDGFFAMFFAAIGV
jgi:phospholipid/cholesterol/gamma-HCH transport system permease protein